MNDSDTEPDKKPTLLDQVERIKAKAALQKKAMPTSIEDLQPMLPFWGDTERGFPNSLARGALFTAIKPASGTGSSRAYYQKKVVASLSGLVVEYRGEELRQDDSSVFMTLLHFGRGLPIGEPIPFTAYAALKELG